MNVSRLIKIINGQTALLPAQIEALNSCINFVRIFRNSYQLLVYYHNYRNCIYVIIKNDHQYLLLLSILKENNIKVYINV
jgi:hypothetical protein